MGCTRLDLTSIFLVVANMMTFTSCFECARSETICPSQVVVVNSESLSTDAPGNSDFVLEQLAETEYQIEFLRGGMHELLLRNGEIAIMDVTFTDPSDRFRCCDAGVGVERLTLDGAELCADFISCNAIEI